MPDVPRILFVDITPSHGAANQDLSATINSFLSLGTKPGLLALKQPLFRDFVPLSRVNLHQIPDGDWRNMWVVEEGINAKAPIEQLDGVYRRYLFNRYTARVAEVFGDILHDVRPEVVHCNNFNPRLAPIVAGCRRFGVPVAMHVRTLGPSNQQMRKMLRDVSLLLVGSDNVRHQILENSGFEPERCVSWHNGIPFAQLDRVAAATDVRAEYGIGDRQKIITLLGRIAPYRGHEDFLEAMSVAQIGLPDIVALIVGRFGYRDLEMAEALQAYAQNNLPNGRARFIFDRKDLESFAAASDLTVLPYRSASTSGSLMQGASRELLLAMGMGAPVIATRNACPAEPMRHRETGILIPEHDPASMIKAMHHVLDNEPEARSMAAQAKQYVRTRYDAAQRTRELLALYDEFVL